MAEREHPVRSEMQVWIKRGFFPSEAKFLQELKSPIMAKGINAPYIRAMVSWRGSAVGNAARHNWTVERYNEYIIKHYAKRGVRPIGVNEGLGDYIRAVYYDYFETWKNDPNAWKGDPGWVSPKAKQLIKAYHERATKREMLKRRIHDYDENITKARFGGNVGIERELRRERKVSVRDLKLMGSE